MATSAETLGRFAACSPGVTGGASSAENGGMSEAAARFVVEELDRASCGPKIKALAIEAITVAAAGGSPWDWRTRVAEFGNRRVIPRLDDAERCMRASGIWPWNG